MITAGLAVVDNSMFSGSQFAIALGHYQSVIVMCIVVYRVPALDSCNEID